MLNIPDPNVIFPNEYGTSCFVKNVVHAPNIEIGDYTYYDDNTDPTGFERNNVLFNYPEFGDRLIIANERSGNICVTDLYGRKISGTELPAPLCVTVREA